MDQPADAPTADAPGAADPRRAAAVALLASETTWCDGAAQLVALADPEGLGPLVAAVRSRTEGSRTCLIDALVRLDAGAHAVGFAASADPARRKLALELMALFQADDQLAALAHVAAADPDPALRTAAVATLDQRKRTPAWRGTMIALLAADDPSVRAGIVDSLAADLRDDLPDALRARLAVEPDATVKARIEAALAGQ